MTVSPSSPKHRPENLVPPTVDDQPGNDEDARRRRLRLLTDVVRSWKQRTAGALAERRAISRDEHIEFLVEYLQPEESWEAMTAELVESFPGAMLAFDDLLRELLAVLEELLLDAALLTPIDDTVTRLALAVAAVQREAGDEVASGFAEALAGLNATVAELERVRSIRSVVLSEYEHGYESGTRASRPATSES